MSIHKLFLNWVVAGVMFGVSFSPTANAGEFTDDFSQPLAAENWNAPGLRRIVSSGRLLSEFDQSSIDNRNPRNRLRTVTSIANPTRVQAIVNLKNVGTVANLDNDHNGLFARIEGYFYNASANLGPDNLNGLVWAALFIGDRGNGLEAWWRWDQSTSADYSTFITEAGTLLGKDPAPLSKDKDYLLTIEYDKAHTFTFTIKPDGDAETTLSKDGPARFATSAINSARLSTGADFKDGGDGSAAIIQAEFDDFLIDYNDGALNRMDGFTGPGLDSSLWRDDAVEGIADLNKKELRMSVQTEVPGLKKRYTSSVSLADTEQNCFYAEATWDSATNIPDLSESQGRTRLIGFLYNDTPQPTTGDDGGMLAQVRIVTTSSGVLEARWNISREPYSDSDIVNTGGTFTTVPIPDRRYPMFFEFDKPGKKILFSFNGETVIYNIQTDIHDVKPGREWKAIQVRIQDNNDSNGNDDATGFLSAAFDKVISGAKCPVGDDNFVLDAIPGVLGAIKK